MDELGPDLGRSTGNSPGALLLHGIEPLPTALKQDSNQSNDDFSAANRGLDRAGNLHISPEGLNWCSLAGMTDEIGTAHRDAQTVIALCEHPHDRPRNPDPPKIVTRVPPFVIVSVGEYS